MKKRSLILWIIGVALILSPVYYYFEKAFLAHLNPLAPLPIFQAMTALKLIGVAMGPIVGILVLAVRPISWYAVVVFSLYTVGVNSMLLLQGQMKLWAFVLNVPTAVGVILFFVRREVMSPYFSPRLRWWQSDRVDFKTSAAITLGQQEISAETLNLSPTGAYLLTDNPPTAGSDFDITLTIGKESLTLRASSVWTGDGKSRPKGVGARFDPPSSQLIRAALASVHTRPEPRHAFALQVDIEGRESLRCKTFDLSATGIFLVTDASFKIGEKLNMTLHLVEHPVTTVGEVVWVSDGSGGKPKGIGVRLVKTSDAIRQQLANMVSQEGTPAKSVPPPAM